MSSTSTNFLNSKRRRIFQGPSGAFYAQAANGGAKVYRPKAMFRKVGGEGATRRIAAHNTVPNKIRSTKYRMSKRKAPASPVYNLSHSVFKTRKVRKNKGVRRKVSASPVYNLNHAVFRTRKVRKNKGAKRGP